MQLKLSLVPKKESSIKIYKRPEKVYDKDLNICVEQHKDSFDLWYESLGLLPKILYNIVCVLLIPFSLIFLIYMYVSVRKSFS